MGYFAMFVAVIFGAINVPAIKYLSESISIEGFGFFRFSLSAIILYFVYRKKTSNVFSSKKTHLGLLLISSGSLALALVLIMYGIDLTTSSSTNAIMILQPILITLGAVLFLKEKVKKKQIIGMFLGFIGVGLVVLLPIFAGGQVIDGITKGNVMIFAAMFASAAYTLVSGRLTKIYGPLILTLSAFSACALTFGIIFIFKILNGGSFFIAQANSNNIALLLLVSIPGTAGMFALYQYGINKISCFYAGLQSYLKFPISIYLGTLFLHETLSGSFFSSTILILVGAFVASPSIE